MSVVDINSRRTGPRMRTQEEIVAQLEARYAEMEAELQKPERKWPCNECRFYRGFELAYVRAWPQCSHPLVTGVGLQTADAWETDRCGRRGAAHLCGPEKALWEPRPPRWQRLLEWIGLHSLVEALK